MFNMYSQPAAVLLVAFCVALKQVSAMIDDHGRQRKAERRAIVMRKYFCSGFCQPYLLSRGMISDVDIFNSHIFFSPPYEFSSRV